MDTNEAILENERKTLDKVISEIDKFINENWYPPGTNTYALYEKIGFGDYPMFFSYINSLHEKSKSYSLLKKSPYFGKIDIRDNDIEESFYISSNRLHEIKNVTVIDWRSPMGALFYEAPRPGSYLINTPNGPRMVPILQKVKLDIQKSSLKDVLVDFTKSDSFQKDSYYVEPDKRSDDEDKDISPKAMSKELPQPPRNSTNPESQRPREVDRFLSLDLQSRGDPKFHTIYKTIQAEQYRIMKLPSDNVVVINGVAGSGKTSVGYHRLAFLAYEERLNPLIPTKVLIIGPNRLFLSFIKELLPSLDIIGVSEITFEDWALIMLGLAIIPKNGKIRREIDITDNTTDLFMSSKVDRKQKKKLWQQSKHKGSLRFGKALEVIIKKGFLPCPIQKGLTITNPDNGNHIQIFTTEELKTIWGNQPKDLTLNQKLNLIKNIVETKITSTSEDLSRRIVSKTRLETIVNRLLQNVTFQFTLYPITVYKKIMNEKLLKIEFNGQEMREIGDFTFNGKSIDLEDLTAVLYIKMLLSAENYKKYDHLLIDEGQDFSPLHYRIFSMLSPSITILGDIAQGIVAHRGLSKWEDIDEIFPNKIIENMLVSYRSTMQITNLANDFLPKVSKNKTTNTPAVPLHREGSYPRLIETTNESSLRYCLLNELNSDKTQDNATVCVITKTEEEARIIYQFLRSQRFDCQLIQSRDLSFTLNKRLTILPINLSKGLEFNKVILYDVSENKYDDSVPYDYRLLYVGITRALNDLVLLSNGTPVKLLTSSKHVKLKKY